MKKPTPFDIARPILLPIGIIQVLSVILLLLSPIIWIWHGFGLFWMCALSFLVTAIVLAVIYKFVEKIVQVHIDKIFKNEQ